MSYWPVVWATYWTVMWITLLDGPYDGQGSFLMYPSLEECEASLTTVSDTLTYDHSLLCEEIETTSGGIHPKRRPEGLGNE